MPATNTIPGIFYHALKECPERTYLTLVDGVHPEGKPKRYTYGKFGEQVRRAIAGMQTLGIGAGSRILILAENSPEWQTIALAGQCLRAEVTGLFATLGPVEVANIVPRVDPDLIFVSNRKQLEKLQPILSKLKRLKQLIGLQEIPSATLSVPHHSFSQLLSTPPLSEEDLKNLVEQVQPEDLFIMIFTSGTTGRFKGVRLPHRSFVASITGGAATLDLKEDGIGMLYLPFGHVAGQCHFYVAMRQHSSLIFCPSRKAIKQAFALGPTYTLLVPFFYERIYRDALKGVSQAPKFIRPLLNRLVKAAIRIGRNESVTVKDRLLLPFAKKSIGKKLKNKLGGKMYLFVSAGSPPDADCLGFFRGLGFEFLNYYGMSESAGTIALDSVLDPQKKLGSPGKPWRTVDLKIAEDGEVLFRGETLMAGYLDDEDNEAAFTPEGFLKTGDLGKLDEEGYLFITGRKKHLIVLRTGEKVSPEAVEQRLNKILELEGSVALGNEQSYLGAGIFVDKDRLQNLEARLGKENVEDYFLNQVRSGFSGMMDFAVPERLFVIPGHPTDYPDLVTPTLKIKREALTKKFRKEIDRIFSH